MIYFKELRITPDNKLLIIDVGIEDRDIFKNVTIESIYLDTLDTFVEGGATDLSLQIYTEIASNTSMQERKNVRLELTKPLFEPHRNNMYFVLVKANILNAPELTGTCTCGEEFVIGTVVNLHGLYCTLMGPLREVEDTCSIPKNFLDTFLKVTTVESAIKAGLHMVAAKYWKKFFMHLYKCCAKPKPCGCHG